MHPVQVSEWKKKLADPAGSVFGSGRPQGRSEPFDEERSTLDSKIRELTVQVDFLIIPHAGRSVRRVERAAELISKT